jgi:hypothetical protein
MINAVICGQLFFALVKVSENRLRRRVGLHLAAGGYLRCLAEHGNITGSIIPVAERFSHN